MRLRIVHASGNPSEVAVTGAEAKLGKDPGCEVAFDAEAYPMVSSLHARIERAGDEWLLTHLSRTNKTLVNNQPVDDVVKIKEGDRIRLGYTGPFLEVVSVDFVPATGFALSLDSAVKPEPLPTPAPAPAKMEQVKVRRVEKPAAKSALIIRTQPAPKQRSLPRGVLWGGVAAAGVIVLAALGFALSKNKARPEPQPPDLVAKNEPKEISAPPPVESTDPPKSEPVKKPETKPVPEPPTVDSLVLILKNGSAPDRKKALEELGRLGPQSRPALAAVLDNLKDQDMELRTLAQNTITRMGPPTPEDVSIYAVALRDSAPEICIFAASQLGALGRHAQSELVVLRALTIDPNSAIAEAAAAAVLRIEADWLPVLMSGLQDKSDDVRYRSAIELALMGANAKAAMPNLAVALADSNFTVRKAARDAFIAIGPDAVMVLGEGLRDTNAEIRRNAIYALGHMGPDARFVLPKLIEVSYDADVRAREEALAALALIGDYAIPYVLQQLEREKEIAKQEALLGALERIGQNAGPAVHQSVKTARPEVVKLTAPVLKKLSLQAAPKARVAHTGQVLVIQNQLLAWFIAVDINSDNFLDKQELAYAFRGPNAMPYDYVPAGKTPRILGASDFVQYPDFAFLSRLDRDHDGRISRSEFELWAYDYAEFLKKDADQRERIMKERERFMECGISEAVRRQREREVAQAWARHQEVLRMQHQTIHMQAVWHQAMIQKPRPKGK